MREVAIVNSYVAIFLGPFDMIKLRFEDSFMVPVVANRKQSYFISSIHKLEVAMAGGWSRDGAVQDQIDASVEDAVQRAKNQLVSGESAVHCDECDATIPEKRRRVIAGVRLCIACQSAREKQETYTGGINRRGSKDSQLR